MADDLIQFPNVERVLREYGERVAELYKRNLIESDALASEKLLRSVKYVLKVGGKSYEVQLKLEDYWKYLERGTKPHWPPVSAIRQWVRVKPVLPRPDALGRKPTEDQLAYLIGRKIAREGTEGTWDLSDAVKAANREFEGKLIEASALDLQSTAQWLAREYFAK